MKGLTLLRKLEKRLSDCYSNYGDTVPAGWEKFPLTGLCYRPRDGCISEDSPFWDSESVENAVTELFRTYYSVIRDELEKRWETIFIVIEPDVMDTTAIVLYTHDSHIVIYEYHRKAWNFAWDTPEEMSQDMEDEYKAMLKNLKERGCIRKTKEVTK
jgi:hypothetical protein